MTVKNSCITVPTGRDQMVVTSAQMNAPVEKMYS